MSKGYNGPPMDFEDINEMIENFRGNNKYNKLSKETEEILRYVYDHLHKNKSGNIEFKFSPSFLGIKKDDRNYLNIKTTQSAVIIERLKEGDCKKFLESQKIEVNSMTEVRWKEKGLYAVRFKELDDFKKCKDKIVEYMNL